MFDGLSTELARFITPFSFIQNFISSDFTNLRSEELTGIFLTIDINAFINSHPTMVQEIAHLQ